MNRRLEDLIGNAQVRFWQCIVPSHRTGTVGTVRWVGDVAHCTVGGCEVTSEHTKAYADDVKRIVTDEYDTKFAAKLAEISQGVAVIEDKFRGLYDMAGLLLVSDDPVDRRVGQQIRDTLGWQPKKEVTSG